MPDLVQPVGGLRCSLLRRRRQLVVLGAVAVLGAGLGTTARGADPSTAARTYYPAEAWRTATPTDVGLEAGWATALAEELTRVGSLHGLLVVKDGSLVFERSGGGYGPDDLHSLQSVTKSVAGTLVGAALRRGHLESLDEPVLSFFPERTEIENLDGRKRAMTLHHALTMRTGMAWTGEDHLDRMYRRGVSDLVQYLLDYPMSDSPGTEWHYNSGIAILLGPLLENATGRSLEAFAREALFEPLGIREASWIQYRGFAHTGGGLSLRPRDLARIGYLMLRDGVWDGRRLLPEGWVERATAPHVPRTRKREGLPLMGYGYLWYLLPFSETAPAVDSTDILLAWGHRGQYLIIVPEHDLIVVATGGAPDFAEEKRRIRILVAAVRALHGRADAGSSMSPTTMGELPSLGEADS